MEGKLEDWGSSDTVILSRQEVSANKNILPNNKMIDSISLKTWGKTFMNYKEK